MTEEGGDRAADVWRPLKRAAQRIEKEQHRLIQCLTDLLDRLAKWLLGEPYKQIKMSVIGPQSKKKKKSCALFIVFVKQSIKKKDNSNYIQTLKRSF